MARYNYFVGGFGDYYSEWHRNKCEGIGYIDIDQVCICTTTNTQMLYNS